MHASVIPGALLARCRVSVLAIVTAWPGMAANADELDDYLQRQRELYQVPAIVVGVLRSGQLTDGRAVGHSNLELDVPASTRHVFEIGSISKQFTAYAVLMLSEQGLLDVSAPVGRYLKELPEEWARPTLHQLMGHISGLPDFENAFGYDIYREVLSDADFLKRLVALPIDFAPGASWSYSNTNYWLLARVIERVSGQTYAEFMEKRVFVPLGMTATRTALPARLLAGRASGYRLADGRLENREAIQPGTGRGLGDVATTIDDMARWEREQREPRLLKPETAGLARQPVKLNDGSATTYGYGWFNTAVLGHPALHHDGQTAGFVATYLRFPERNLAIVVLTNRYGAPVSARHIARVVDPGIAPEWTPVPGADAKRLERVRALADGAIRARTAWREEWFAADSWRELKPYLGEVEDNARRRGPLRSVTAVGVAGVQDAARPSYRVVFERTTRVMTFSFDEQDRIKSIESEDE